LSIKASEDKGKGGQVAMLVHPFAPDFLPGGTDAAESYFNSIFYKPEAQASESHFYIITQSLGLLKRFIRIFKPILDKPEAQASESHFYNITQALGLTKRFTRLRFGLVKIKN